MLKDCHSAFLPLFHFDPSIVCNEMANTVFFNVLKKLLKGNALNIMKTTAIKDQVCDNDGKKLLIALIRDARSTDAVDFKV